MEFIIILFLILLNGLFAMTEIAIVSSRKTKLETMAKNGSKRAKKVLALIEHPNKFLSTIQIGITFIGIFLGFYSGGKIAASLETLLVTIPWIAPYANFVSSLVVVLLITYISLVLGELVPKRIGMSYPESLSKQLVYPINFISKITSPFVWLLSVSTNLIIRLFNIKSDANKVTEEEIKVALQEGFEGGEVMEMEQDMIQRVFSLADRKISSLVTQRSDVVWLDISDSQYEVFEKIKEEVHAVYPVINNDIDNIIGILNIKDLFETIGQTEFQLSKYIKPAYFIPENLSILSALEKFKEEKKSYAFVMDEFGYVQGIVTITDILEALIGDIGTESADEYEIKERTPNSWFVDGQYPFYELLNFFEIEDKYNDYPYNTLSGLILEELKRIPQVGDKLSWLNFEIEILDMDKARIDKVLITRIEMDDE